MVSMNNDMSQFGQSEVLLKYLNYENGFFIEAGANDGVVQSNTFYFEKELNWTGLLIEPIILNMRGMKIELIYM